MEEYFFIFLFVLAAICIVAYWGAEYAENERSPVVTEKAVLVRKISSTVVDAGGAVNTTLVLQFYIDGAILKCPVSGGIYRQAREGMEGLLTHQGTRFQCFEADGVKIEKQEM